jgi:hypothetical protein
MVDLNEKELALAREILEQEFLNLKEEIYKTEDTDYHARLKERRDTLESLVRKLSEAAPTGG